jgi:hypothetical protein
MINGHSIGKKKSIGSPHALQGTAPLSGDRVGHPTCFFAPIFCSGMPLRHKALGGYDCEPQSATMQAGAPEGPKKSPGAGDLFKQTIGTIEQRNPAGRAHFLHRLAWDL